MMRRFAGRPLTAIRRRCKFWRGISSRPSPGAVKAGRRSRRGPALSTTRSKPTSPRILSSLNICGRQPASSATAPSHAGNMSDRRRRKSRSARSPRNPGRYEDAMTEPKKLSPEEQKDLDWRMSDAASRGDTQAVRRLLAASANVHAGNDEALRGAADHGHTATVQVLLTAGANVNANDDEALCWAVNRGLAETVTVLLAAGANVYVRDNWALHWTAFTGRTQMMQVLARHIFASESWCGKSRTEIENHADALYNKIKTFDFSSSIKPEYLRQAGTILLDCALTCWEQVRPPPPPGFKISPLPAQPRAL